MRIRIILVALLMVFLSPIVAVAETHESASSTVKKEEPKPVSEAKKILPSDVRVLIDISGSMKQTDPQNLRKPALDLIVRLLPDKSRAGIWTFGNSVNMLMPYKPVDAAWRKQAAPKANEITSNAMFTNIGKALDEVSFDKKNLSQDYKTHIILLTDGVEDIGSDAVVNNKERQRIISDILPSLKSAGYIIHTIALSADADTDLLKKLSVATDGVATTAVSADQLMSVFLKIFDQAVPAERVPLDNNGFLVDASIKEFTALIFRKPGEDRTIIAAPDGKEYSATAPNDGINWYRTDKYDLITADSPKAGQWKIKTGIAPQSRITVVSNLQLMVEPPKNNIHVNDALPITYSFQENGKTITNKDFLGLIEANSIVAKDGTEENFDASLTLPSPPDDGMFHKNLTTFTSAGDYEVHIYVDGKTFKREFKHSVSVRDSNLILEKSNASADDGKITYNYKIALFDKTLDAKKIQLTVAIKNSQNNNVEKNLNITDDHWEFSFTPVQEGDYTVDIHAQGNLAEGGLMDETLHADSFTYRIKKAEAQQSSVAETPKAVPEEKPKEENSNLTLYIAIAVGNLFLLVVGFFAYRLLMGGKAKDELAEFEKTLAATPAKENKTGGKPVENKVSTKPPVEKTEIDLSDEEPAHIPMSDDSAMDKLFPLDSMDEDPNTNDDK